MCLFSADGGYLIAPNGCQSWSGASYGATLKFKVTGDGCSLLTGSQTSGSSIVNCVMEICNTNTYHDDAICLAPPDKCGGDSFRARGQIASMGRLLP